MKAKGLVNVKYDKKRNLVRGDVIELDNPSKILAAVKDAVGQKLSVDGECQCWPDEITIDENFSVTSKGEMFFGKYNNNHYKATGKVGIRTLNVKTDKLKPVKEHTYDIEFCDHLDALNQPDLKVISFNLK